MTHNLIRFLLVLVFPVLPLSAISDDNPFSNPDIFPLQDYVIFSRLGKSLEEISTVSEFGIFRDNEPKETQWIEATPREEILPGALAPVRYLSLQYVLIPGKLNGFRVSLRKKGQDNSWFDWNGFRDSTLILRIGMGETCTSRFRLELKYLDPKTDSILTAFTYVDLDSIALADIDTKGYTEVAIPLKTLVGSADLSNMRELVLVFEGDKVTELKGELKLFNIRIASKPVTYPDVDALLEDLSQRTFSWFPLNQHPITGLIRDRSTNSVGLAPENDICSIASIGFYLSALPNAIESGWMDSEAARKNTIKALEFLRSQVETYFGIFPHFLYLSTGKRAWNCEYSILDSAILLNGCIVASEYFGGEVAALTNELLNRIDWSRFLTNVNGHTLLSMGWREEHQKLEGPMDVRSSEFSMPLFLAIGSGQVNPDVWYNTEIKQSTIEGFTVLNPTHGLFTSYYSLCWWDLENKRDCDNIDLFQNARNVALANRALSRKSAARTYSSRHGGFWGTSAGDYGFNYHAPSILDVESVQTVWPITSLAAIPFIPDIVKDDLNQWQQSEIWPFINGPYGIAPLSIDKKWVGHDIIGIDIGSFHLNHINSKNQSVWKWFMKHPIAQKTMKIIYSAEASKWSGM